MGMSFIGILLLVGGTFFPNLLESPPRDLASLVRPEPALLQMGVTVEEAALIDLLKTEAPAAAAEQSQGPAAAAKQGPAAAPKEAPALSR